MTVFDDLEAEQDRLEEILAGLDSGQWAAASGAAGWSVADVVLHLAQSDEGVVTSISGDGLQMRVEAVTGETVDTRAEDAVRAQRAAPEEVFARWQRDRAAAMAALREADPQQPFEWVTGPVKAATLATTRLAEYWTHGLDITGPLGIDYPDTERLRHIAWLAHRTLPYALTLGGERPAAVRCELTSPNGTEVWRFGPEDAESSISGPAGEFCRVGAQRLDPARSVLQASGPHGATALRLLRTYA
jgi:uncharacterized protein (TIGR03084 family)